MKNYSANVVVVLFVIVNNVTVSSSKKFHPVGVKMCCLICKRENSCRTTTYSSKTLVCDVTGSDLNDGESVEDICKNSNEVIQDSCMNSQCEQGRECLTNRRKEIRCVPKMSPRAREKNENRHRYKTLLRQSTYSVDPENKYVQDFVVINRSIFIALLAVQTLFRYVPVNNTILLKNSKDFETNKGSLYNMISFGKKIVLCLFNTNSLHVFNTDLTRITFIETSYSYQTIAAAGDTAIIGYVERSFHFLTIQDNKVVSRTVVQSKANIDHYFVATVDFNILYGDTGKSAIVCVNQTGYQLWNATASFSNYYLAATKNGSHVFFVSEEKSLTYLKDKGKTNVKLVSNVFRGKSSQKLVIDEFGTLYVISLHTVDIFVFD